MRAGAADPVATADESDRVNRCGRLEDEDGPVFRNHRKALPSRVLQNLRHYRLPLRCHRRTTPALTSGSEATNWFSAWLDFPKTPDRDRTTRRKRLRTTPSMSVHREIADGHDDLCGPGSTTVAHRYSPRIQSAPVEYRLCR